MTTIAWDGRILAGDTLASDNWGLKSWVPKIFAGRDCVMGGAGSRANIMRWWKEAQHIPLAGILERGYPDYDKEKNDPSILLIGLDGAVYKHCEGIFLEEVRGPAAIGSGRDYALATMRLGKSSREAVGVAAVFDVNTGPEVQTIQVLPKLEVWGRDCPDCGEQSPADIHTCSPQLRGYDLGRHNERNRCIKILLDLHESQNKSFAAHNYYQYAARCLEEGV